MFDMPTTPISQQSPAQILADQPLDVQHAFYAALSAEEARLLLSDWQGFWARPKQRFPETLGKEHLTWNIIAGRGFGKSRTGAESVRYMVEELGYRRIALVGRTAADVRDVMVEGQSGLLSVFPDDQKPKYEPAKRRVTFANGAIASCYSADKPDQLRGPQHDGAWCDELAAWRYAEAWDQLQFGLRLRPESGLAPLAIITTTPRPLPIIKALIKDVRVLTTIGTTYENARNLATPALRQLVQKYKGTRLGLQELEAHILDDTPGALWTRKNLDEQRKTQTEIPLMVRVVVGIDPSVSSHENSAETGIVVAGIDRFGHLYILDDVSLKGRPSEWAKAAIGAYEAYEADRIIAEVNNGGDMVETTIRTQDKNVSFKQVHASKGKYTRAEPVSALYEQGRVSHVGAFGELEDQMCTWLPGDKSPDRLDALVWAITELALRNKGRMASNKAGVRGMYPSQNRSDNTWGRR